MPSILFSPLALRDVVLRNRIVVGPMCQYSARHGCAGDWHLIHLGYLALGGAGMLVLEATAVSPEGRITHGCLGLYDDACEEALARVVAFIRRNSNTVLALQLSHAGRKASSALPWEGGKLLAMGDGGWETVSASAVPQLPGERQPVALDLAGMQAVAATFVDAAVRADRIGFDALELHAAHGYLLHQFLSPLSNRRTDAFGGALENRARFPLDLFRQVRAAWPQGKPLGVRISATDWVPGGWELDEAHVFARWLEEAGCDWIDVSGGGVSHEQRITTGPGYQVPFAERIRSTGVRTIAVGQITQPAQAEEILQAGKADLVALARGMLAEPRWAWRAARELGGHVVPPPQYYRRPPAGEPDIFVTAQPTFR